MRYLLNEVLESAILNIMIEANQGGSSLTDRPRLFAPPPIPIVSSIANEGVEEVSS